MNKKFKAKSVKDNSWVYGSLINNLQFIDYPVEVFILEDQEVYNTDDIRLTRVIPETVCQYLPVEILGHKTGFYEGDFIASDWGYDNIVDMEGLYYAVADCTISDNVKVVGNIHDYPIEVLYEMAQQITLDNE